MGYKIVGSLFWMDWQRKSINIKSLNVYAKKMKIKKLQTLKFKFKNKLQNI